MSDYGIKTYADLAETCGGMVLANEIASRPLEPVSGDWAPWEEIFQWYIVRDRRLSWSTPTSRCSTTRSLTCTCGESRTSGPAGTTCRHLKSIEKGSSLTLLPHLFGYSPNCLPLSADLGVLGLTLRALA